jgi:hypothetical protein
LWLGAYRICLSVTLCGVISEIPVQSLQIWTVLHVSITSDIFESCYCVDHIPAVACLKLFHNLICESGLISHPLQFLSNSDSPSTTVLLVAVRASSSTCSSSCFRSSQTGISKNRSTSALVLTRVKNSDNMKLLRTATT